MVLNPGRSEGEYKNEVGEDIFPDANFPMNRPGEAMLFQNTRALTTLLFTAAASPSVLGCFAGAEGEGRAAASDSVVTAILGSAAEQAPPPSFSPRIPNQEQEAQPLDLNQMGYNRGSSDAPVRVMEISDFGCGYCRLFHQETFPTLLDVYVEAGLVQWKFIPFVLGMFPNGLEASIAAECSGEQELFFPMQRRLFLDQSGWKNSEDPFPFFADLAEEEGLDVERFNRCIEGGWRENQVRANVRLGREIGVRGTPTFLIDGIPISGALPLDTFRDIQDLALTQKGLTPPARGQ